MVPKTVSPYARSERATCGADLNFVYTWYDKCNDEDIP